jgi:hypothetical protein
MSPLVAALVIFVSVFGSVLAGLALQSLLPASHLRDESKDTIRTGAGLIATLTALVLGLLVGSAKSSFDAINAGLMQVSTKIILLDRMLTRYGPRAQEARDDLRGAVASAIERSWPEIHTGIPKANPRGAEPGIELLQDQLLKLSPKDESERWTQLQALRMSSDLAQSRELLIQQTEGSLPAPFIVVLTLWLMLLYFSFGLFAPRNFTAGAVLLVCALSTSGAVFLILEMSHPLSGTMRVSSAPLVEALRAILTEV